MSNETIKLGPDLVRALDEVLGHEIAALTPVVVVAAFLDKLAKGRGLSEKFLDDDRYHDISMPAFASDVLSRLFGDLEDWVGLADRVYDALVATAPDAATRRALNKANPLSEVQVRLTGQIYWNLVGSDRRPKLPLRPRGSLDIPAGGSLADFASMSATSRRNAKFPDKVVGNRFGEQGALLSVLMAQHIVESADGTLADLSNFPLTRSVNAKGAPSVLIGDAAMVPTPTTNAPTDSSRIHLADEVVVDSRERARYLVDCLEEDLRQAVDQLQGGELTPEALLGPDYSKAFARHEGSSTADSASLTSFLLPQEAYDVLLRHASALPSEFVTLLEENLVDFEEFLPARNRIMKGRPLQPGDLAEAAQLVQAFLTPLAPRSEAGWARLVERPHWQPRHRTGSEVPDLVLHNLPAPDFDETGLLGRESQIRDVVRLLKSPRERIVTLIGEGGVGKTALALEVAYRLVDDPESPYEYVLWTSLKNEALTARGVETLSNSVRDLVSAAGDLGHFLDPDSESSSSELSSMLGASRALLVIDNMETTLGEDIIEFVDSLPEATILFTSRRGVGSLERRVPVGPLDSRSAEQLFRTFAGSRGSELVNLSSEKITETVRRLRYSPLSIRWCVLSVVDGRPLTDVLHHQDDLLEYCVGNVVAGLSPDSRTILSVLRALDRPVSVQELAVVSDTNTDAFSEAIKLLVQASLVVRSHVVDDIEHERLTLSSTARAYLPPTAEPELVTRTLQRERLLLEDHDRDQQKIAETGRYFDPNIVFQRTAHDGPVAHLLRKALRESKVGEFGAADSALQRARALDPTYFEVDRVDAFLASMRREEARATTLYRSAIEHAATDEQRFWVTYFFAAHLARTAGDIPGAIRLAEQTHAYFNRYDTAVPLGNYYTWVGRFAEGHALIASALAESPTEKNRRIVTTTLVDCLRLWADSDVKGGLSETGLSRALEAANVGLRLHESDTADEYLANAIVRATATALEAARASEPNAASAEDLVALVRRVLDDEALNATRVQRTLENQIIALPDDLRERLAPGFANGHQDPGAGPRLRGTIRNVVDDRYGFIAHPDFPNNIFFQAGWLTGASTLHGLKPGTVVDFTPTKNDKGQDQAIHVVVHAHLEAMGDK